MSMFLLLHPGAPGAALDDVLRFTHYDRYPALDGYTTFSPHWRTAAEFSFQPAPRHFRIRSFTKTFRSWKSFWSGLSVRPISKGVITISAG